MVGHGNHFKPVKFIYTTNHLLIFGMNKKYWKIGLITITGIVFLVLSFAPGIAKRFAVKKSKELIGRQISLEKIKINYFSSTIRLIDFKLFEADEKDVFVSFDTLLVNLAPLRLIKNEKVIEQFYLKGLTTSIIQYDSIFNFTDLVEFHQSEPDTSVSEPFQYILSNLEMNEANIKYTDASIDKTIIMRDMNFFIPYIAWNQEDKSEAGIKFNFLKEGYFQSTLNVNLKEGVFDANIIISRLYLNTFSDFLKKYVQLDSIKGVINSNINIEGNLDEVEKSILSGSFELLDFELTDLNRRKLVGLNKMNLSLDEIDVNNQKFIIDSLRFTQPYIHFELYDSSNNFFDFLGIHPTPEDETAGETDSGNDTLKSVGKSPVSFALNSFVIEKGVIDYTDHRTSEPFNYYLSELAMSVDSISSQADWIDTYSHMLLNNRGELNAELGLNPQDPLNLKLNLVITDFLLSDLNIYSKHYMGSSIVKGDMYYKSNTNISGGQITSENKLIIKNAEIEETDGGLHDLPLKFAFFLLKDRQGVIDLDIPVSGDLKDPNLSIGKIVWDTFKNLIAKAAAAPFDLLAGLISVDPKDIQAIEFAYVDTTLTDKRKKQLDLLLTLEEKKEGLGIELVYFNDIEKERGQICIAEAGKQFSSETGKDYLTDKEDFKKYVTKEVQSDSIDLTLACLELTDKVVIDSLAAIFKEKRISLVNDYLMFANDSTCIFTSFSNSEAPGNIGSIPRFEVKYSMTDIQTEESGNGK